ncbi:hypothetical protein M2160_002938 [Streptomyces sp. SAI-117]|nr:hypothetical protein [Streptomyces sp. SAI-117]
MSNTPMAANPLTRAVLEIDEYASGLGWDQPARLFALVDTARLRAQEPALAGQLGLQEGQESAGFTPIEQDEIPAGKPLDEFLGTIAWPDAVVGCALTVERLMLPPSAEASVPQGLSEAKLAKWVAGHPDRQEVRMTVAVLRGTAPATRRCGCARRTPPRRSSRAATWSQASRRRCRRPSRSSPAG